MKHSRINLRKAWELLKRHEHPSEETLNHLALLVGFQNWKELQDAFHEEKREENEGN